jgi:4-amino-4-deoxy-L-arabinose transferase-like glycosyltransferase
LPSTIRNFVLIFFSCLLLHTAGTWIIPLMDRDEPRFAEASREMRERGNYVVPYFNNKYRFDKPPFIYWTQIASYRLFGENDFAARWPSGIAAALTAVLLFAWGRRLGSERVGWWAAIIFSLCLQTFIHAKAAVADMWLVFFVTAAFWAAYELIADLLGQSAAPADSPHRKYWRLMFYVALAFAFLAKGPLGWMPLLTAASMKFFLRGQPLNRRFCFASGSLFTVAIVLLWGIPALIRTNGEFFWVGIGRHVVERSFGALEGHGGQSWSSYLVTLPFYFGTVFISFFPWSIKLPALIKHLWRRRDGVDTYLILGVAIIFVLMTIVKTKLPHYTLTAFPLLSLLLARHLFELRSFFAQCLRRLFPRLAMTRRLLELPPSPRFAVRAAAGALALWLTVSLVVFPIAARAFPTVQLFEKSKNDLRPEMHFGNVDYAEPSVVWYFRSRVHGFFWSGRAEDAKRYMEFWGPKFIIVPTDVAKAVYPELPPGWKSYTAQGFNFAKGKSTDLTLILKPTNE